MKEVILKGEYFEGNFLPSGVVWKNATGIGATYHELFIAKRDSIVLTPYISILESKKDPSILTIHSEIIRNNPDCISDYFNNHSGFKKIHATIESFLKLGRTLRKMGINIIKDFYLVLDEVHIVQTDSYYRPSICQAFDIYKLYPVHKRTCISATLYPFSDHVLNSEPFTVIKALKKLKDIEVHVTDDPILMVGLFLRNCNEQEQLHIYVRSVFFILRVISDYKLKDVSIFCGKGSKEKAGAFYKPFETTPKSKINFYTAHALTGCDNFAGGIQIVISGHSHGQNYTLLSAQLFHALGRHRNGVSRTILISTHYQGKMKRPKDIRQILESKAISLIKKQNPKISKNRRAVEEAIIHSDDIVRFDISKKRLAINYPLIDSKYIEALDRYTLHNKEDSMRNFLAKEYNVTFSQRCFNNNPIPFPKVGRKPLQVEFQSALKLIEGYEFSLERLNDTTPFTFDVKRFRKDVIKKANLTEAKFLEAYTIFPDFDSFRSSNGDLEHWRKSQLQRAFEHDDEIITILNTELPVGTRLKISDLVPILQRLFKILGWDRAKVTNRLAKKQLAYFRKYRDCKVSKARETGVEIVA